MEEALPRWHSDLRSVESCLLDDADKWSQSSELHPISGSDQQVLETDRQNANCREGSGVVTPGSNSVPVLNEKLSQPILSSQPVTVSALEGSGTGMCLSMRPSSSA